MRRDDNNLKDAFDYWVPIFSGYFPLHHHVETHTLLQGAFSSEISSRSWLAGEGGSILSQWVLQYTNCQKKCSLGLVLTCLWELLPDAVAQPPPSLPPYTLVTVVVPPCVQVHPCGRYRHNTVVFILAKEYNLKNLRTIHRLDRLTSGKLAYPPHPTLPQPTPSRSPSLPALMSCHFVPCPALPNPFPNTWFPCAQTSLFVE